MKQLYGNENIIEERHRHRYEVNPDLVKEFESAGMIFVGQDLDATRMEIMELKNHPFYAAVQYHPEYLSREAFINHVDDEKYCRKWSKLVQIWLWMVKISRKWPKYGAENFQETVKIGQKMVVYGQNW